jgi:hypothetical protein
MKKILWCIDLLLGRDPKWMSTDNAMQQVDKQTPVSKQQLGKHVPAKTISGLITRQPPMKTMERLLVVVLSVVSAPRLYNKDTSRAAAQLLAVQLSEVTRNRWLVSEFSYQLKVSL